MPTVTLARTDSKRQKPGRKPGVVPGRKPTTPALPTDLIPETKLLPPDDARMRKLGLEIAGLLRTSEADYLTGCLEIGVKLRQARTRLAHGDWLPWLEKYAALPTRTAERYIRLSTWADENPDDLRRWRTLGATKLGLVATAQPPAIAKLRKREPAKLAAMTVQEFAALLITKSKTTSQTPKQRAASIHRAALRLLRDVHELIAAKAFDRKQAERLRKTLLEAAEALHG